MTNIDQHNIHTDDALPVMEHFYTIQGEGFHQGKAAYFIRLAGCDVGCTWCDVKESWDPNNSSLLGISNIVAFVKNSDAEIAIITGGEPLMYNLDKLTEALQTAGVKTHIETSGAHPLSGNWDWVCVSPKKFKQPIQANLPFANELKIIVFNKSDFDWAEDYAKQVGSNCKLYLQPEWEKAPQITPLIVEYVKANPKWELSVQIHKYINVP